jgi:hypothetical protein
VEENDEELSEESDNEKKVAARRRGKDKGVKRTGRKTLKTCLTIRRSCHQQGEWENTQDEPTVDTAKWVDGIMMAWLDLTNSMLKCRQIEQVPKQQRWNEHCLRTADHR